MMSRSARFDPNPNRAQQLYGNNLHIVGYIRRNGCIVFTCVMRVLKFALRPGIVMEILTVQKNSNTRLSVNEKNVSYAMMRDIENMVLSVQRKNAYIYAICVREGKGKDFWDSTFLRDSELAQLIWLQEHLIAWKANGDVDDSCSPRSWDVGIE